MLPSVQVTYCVYQSDCGTAQWCIFFDTPLSQVNCECHRICYISQFFYWFPLVKSQYFMLCVIVVLRAMYD